MRHILDHGTPARTYPEAGVEFDPISVRGGAAGTSAGVTAGIDLRFVLVKEDSGAKRCWR